MDFAPNPGGRIGRTERDIMSVAGDATPSFYCHCFGMVLYKVSTKWEDFFLTFLFCFDTQFKIRTYKQDPFEDERAFWSLNHICFCGENTCEV